MSQLQLQTPKYERPITLTHFIKYQLIELTVHHSIKSKQQLIYFITNHLSTLSIFVYIRWLISSSWNVVTLNGRNILLDYVFVSIESLNK